ncbi:MAG: hypothetical protein WCJ30_27135, partial [Deltaproteobacteria bacterium]
AVKDVVNHYDWHATMLDCFGFDHDKLVYKRNGAALALTPETEVASVDMDFSYASAFGTQVHPAYETLLLDCMLGDATLFTRSDEVETGWRITDPLLDFWEKVPPAKIHTYSAGTWGPSASDEFIARDGFRWRQP